MLINCYCNEHGSRLLLKLNSYMLIINRPFCHTSIIAARKKYSKWKCLLIRFQLCHRWLLRIYLLVVHLLMARWGKDVLHYLWVWLMRQVLRDYCLLIYFSGSLSLWLMPLITIICFSYRDIHSILTWFPDIFSVLNIIYATLIFQ